MPYPMSYCSNEYTKLIDEEGYPVKVHYPDKKLSKGRSCCCCCLYFFGLLTLTFMLFAIGTSIYTYTWTKHEVKLYTVTEPKVLPIHDVPKAELEIVKDRAKLFADTLAAGQVPAMDLVVTADELNGFIASSHYLRGNAYVTITDNKISTEWSLPANSWPGGRGRYFVASGSIESAPLENDKNIDMALVTTKLDTIKPIPDLDGPLLFAELVMYWQQDVKSIYSHELMVNIKRGKFLNWVVPQDFIDEKVSLVDFIYDDDEDDDCDYDPRVILAGIENVSFENGAIVVHARRPDNHLSATTTDYVTEEKQALVQAVNKENSAFSRASQKWVDHGTRKLKFLKKKLMF